MMDKVTEKKIKDFKPVLNKIYNHTNGLRYKVTEIIDDEYVLVRCVSSGWTCRVKGMYLTKDGKIEWQYSMYGRFEEDGMQNL